MHSDTFNIENSLTYLMLGIHISILVYYSDRYWKAAVSMLVIFAKNLVPHYGSVTVAAPVGVSSSLGRQARITLSDDELSIVFLSSLLKDQLEKKKYT